jgi:hypothetical protein
MARKEQAERMTPSAHLAILGAQTILGAEIMEQRTGPFSEPSAKEYFEAVIAAILASSMNAAGQGTAQETIDIYKRMLQQLRATPDGVFK